MPDQDGEHANDLQRDPKLMTKPKPAQDPREGQVAKKEDKAPQGGTRH